MADVRDNDRRNSGRSRVGNHFWDRQDFAARYEETHSTLGEQIECHNSLQIECDMC
jgi:hypothetical protein